MYTVTKQNVPGKKLGNIFYLYVMKKNIKILVMERVSALEPVLSAYIRQNFPDSEVEVLYRIDDVRIDKIIEKVQWCDMIVVQSIFEYKFKDGMKSFRNMIELFYNKPELRRPAHIIHSKGDLIPTLNFQLGQTHTTLLKEILDEGYELFNVYFREYENPENNLNSFFSKPTIKKFAAVKMWHEPIHDWIWDEHEHFLPKGTTDVFLYKYKTQFVKSKPDNKYSKLTVTDLKVLDAILQENYYRLTELVQDLETGYGWKPEPGEKKELLTEHNKKLKLLNKLEIESFR